MTIDGREVHFRSARDALAAGIGMVHQELSVVPDLTVAENVYLGKQPIRAGIVDWRAMFAGAREQLASLGIDVDPQARMGSLAIGLQQLIELARVLFSGARIVILDEPTSALSPPEVQRLFEVLRGVRASGRSIVFISHFLDDVLAISDTVTIFRNGRRIVTEARRQHRQGLGDRAHDRPRPRGAGGELYRRDRARQQARRAGRPRGCAGSAPGAPSPTSRSTSGPARCWASTASWAAARSSWPARCSASSRPSAGTLSIDGRVLRLRNTAGGAPRRHRLRAGEPALDAVPPRAGLQEHVDQRAGPHRAALAEARRRARHRAPACRGAVDPAADGRHAAAAACRAATSRRWRWPSG